MDGIQGAILSVKLKYLDAWTKQRNYFSSIYRDEIASRFNLAIQDNSTSACHLFVIHCEEEKLINYLKTNNVGTGIHYPIPIHLQKAITFRVQKRRLANSEKVLIHV